MAILEVAGTGHATESAQSEASRDILACRAIVALMEAGDAAHSDALQWPSTACLDMPEGSCIGSR